MEPKVNPKTGNDIVFVSGRSGPQQIYRMNMDGADIEQAHTGEGEASIRPGIRMGRHRVRLDPGFEPGNFNIFIMDVATRQYRTADTRRGTQREPDGRRTECISFFHLAAAADRRSSRCWPTDTQVKQLTTQGKNEKPVWAKVDSMKQ